MLYAFYTTDHGQQATDGMDPYGQPKAGNRIEPLLPEPSLTQRQTQSPAPEASPWTN